ncbi:Alpha-1,2-mannosyltransferase ALG9 [Oopsacas minuta]|uniref:Mannosyltransferase n=1 Tax=Oopsacas minuta TaxID=111878 RepID=A0AAV7KCQ7_9METZ|nr:Alpha-1,2-mannosyltransferase ALG9 [Oopsacas minuta]
MSYLSTCLLLFLSFLRIFSSLYNIINDCDETFNYWEPLHYILFSQGLQTWEYSPVYAIRSYLYIILHAIPLYPLRYYVSKIVLFYFLRVCLAVFSILVESYFINSVRRRFSTSLSHTLTFVLAVNTGMFISTTAFLPSTFALQFVTLAYTAWWNTNLKLSVFCIAISALIGWPFSAALGLPIAIDIIFIQRRFRLFAFMSAVSLLIIGSALICVDSYYFGRLVFAPMNIILYNIFSKSGPTLYGTEPVTYYLLNLLLNFNIVFLISLLYLPIISISYILNIKSLIIKNSNILLLSSLGPCIWLLIFFSQPHKEERFLYPIYPLLSLYGSVVIHYLANIFRNTRVRQLITALSLIIYSLLSLSRISILVTGYRAPIVLYSLIHYSFEDIPVSDPNTVLCVGREWYRFPSNFFLPSGKITLGFMKSEFRGQLPQKFNIDSREIPEHMNDMNLEELTSYTAYNNCDFIVDIDTGDNSLLEPDFINNTQEWKLIYSYPFLDKINSHRIFRAFYLPFISSSDTYVTYRQYYLLGRVHKNN